MVDAGTVVSVLNILNPFIVCTVGNAIGFSSGVSSTYQTVTGVPAAYWVVR